MAGLIQRKGHNMTLEVTDRAIDVFAEGRFDPVYSARFLKRAIQSRAENPLATEILSGRFSSGDIISSDLIEDELVFRSQLELSSKAA